MNLDVFEPLEIDVSGDSFGVKVESDAFRVVLVSKHDDLPTAALPFAYCVVGGGQIVPVAIAPAFDRTDEALYLVFRTIFNEEAVFDVGLIRGKGISDSGKRSVKVGYLRKRTCRV